MGIFTTLGELDDEQCVERASVSFVAWILFFTGIFFKATRAMEVRYSVHVLLVFQSIDESSEFFPSISSPLIFAKIGLTCVWIEHEHLTWSISFE